MIVEHWQDGVLVNTYDDGVNVQTWPALDTIGRMATLSAILHNDAQDWSNATGIPIAHLEHEALAWSLGGA